MACMAWARVLAWVLEWVLAWVFLSELVLSMVVAVPWVEEWGPTWAGYVASCSLGSYHTPYAHACSTTASCQETTHFSNCRKQHHNRTASRAPRAPQAPLPSKKPLHFRMKGRNLDLCRTPCLRACNRIASCLQTTPSANCCNQRRSHSARSLRPRSCSTTAFW